VQYILTQEEFDDLTKKKRELTLMERTRLQRLCTLIADTMPVKWGWGQPDEPRPWGCILTPRAGEWYCDQCPVRELCPHPHKNYSK
jgi:hypothetical protein